MGIRSSSRHSKRDPHNWNPLENYVYLHERHIREREDFIRPGSAYPRIRLVSTPMRDHDIIVLRANLLLANDVQLIVAKAGDVDRTPARKVKMMRYRYHAWIPGQHNLLRYDNLHASPDEYHRHEYDPRTGAETNFTVLSRVDFPVMHQVIDEILTMYPKR